MKECVASTGWISLCDSGVSTQEEAAGVQEQGWEPSYTLLDFYGADPTFEGFAYVPYKDQ
jgi:hypothetical protein